MPWPQKTPPRALTRGQSLLHNKMGFSDHALVRMHQKRFPTLEFWEDLKRWKPAQGCAHQPDQALSKDFKIHMMR